jgi:2,4-dienoyl-CoA reductase-like NADH-dependent reductase (Old Yellow Enzyme family)
VAEHPNPWLLVEEFRRGASYAKAANFDGVELHGANGYLFAQFFDPVSNQRTDQWGGSVENRAKFCLECLKVVIEVFGADRVGIK